MYGDIITIPKKVFWVVTMRTYKWLPTFRRHTKVQPWRWRQNVPPKRWYLPTSPHSVTTQKTSIDNFTSNPSRNHVFPALCLNVTRVTETRRSNVTQEQTTTTAYLRLFLEATLKNVVLILVCSQRTNMDSAAYGTSVDDVSTAYTCTPFSSNV
jgi:hypothetical protein